MFEKFLRVLFQPLNSPALSDCFGLYFLWSFWVWLWTSVSRCRPPCSCWLRRATLMSTCPEELRHLAKNSLRLVFLVLSLEAWSRKLRRRSRPGAFYVSSSDCSTLGLMNYRHRLEEAHVRGSYQTALLMSCLESWQLLGSFWKSGAFHLSRVAVGFCFASPNVCNASSLRSSFYLTAPQTNVVANVGVDLQSCFTSKISFHSRIQVFSSFFAEQQHLLSRELRSNKLCFSQAFVGPETSTDALIGGRCQLLCHPPCLL